MVKGFSTIAVRFLSALAAAVFWTGAALADKRVALVIGNSDYSHFSRKLINPANDAHDLAQALKQIGFDVTLRTDVGKAEFDQALVEFARKATSADTALFYYAGHGVQRNGQNYFLPIDIETPDEFEFNYRAVSQDNILYAVGQAKSIKIVILDACRDNPLAKQYASRSFGGGLARIDSAEETLIAYAAAPGSFALDGQGRNSPFAAALIKRVKEPGLEIGTMFRRVANDVYEQTGGRQHPEITSSLRSDYFLNPAESASDAWGRIHESTDAAVLKEFIRKFPASPLARDAQIRIDLLDRIRREDEQYRKEAERRALEAEQKLKEEAKKREEERRAQEAEQKRQEEKERQEAIRLAVEAERKRIEEDIRKENELRAEAEKKRLQEEAAKKEADRRALEAEKKRQEEAARKEAERIAAEAEKKRQEELAAKKEAERLAQEAERKQKDEEARKEAERVALEAEKKRQEEAARKEAKRVAAEAEKKRQEEIAAKKEAERLAQEAERKRQGEATRKEAERLAAEAEQKRQEAAARKEAERQALEAEKKRKAEEAAKKEAERLAQEAERKRQEEAARKEAERLAAEAEKKRQEELAAKKEAERLAQEAEKKRNDEEARKEAERQAEEKRAAEERRVAALEEKERERQEAEQEKQRIARLCEADQNALDQLTRTQQTGAIEKLAKDTACPTLKPTVETALKQIARAVKVACDSERKALGKAKDLDSLKAAVARMSCEPVRSDGQQRLAKLEDEFKRNQAVCADESAKLHAIDETAAGARQQYSEFLAHSLCPSVASETNAHIKKIDSRLKEAQTQLARLGCYSGKVSGKFDEATKHSLEVYYGKKGSKADSDHLGDGLVSELKEQNLGLCPEEKPAAPVIAKPVEQPAKEQAKKEEEPAAKPARHHKVESAAREEAAPAEKPPRHKPRVAAREETAPPEPPRPRTHRAVHEEQPEPRPHRRAERAARPSFAPERVVRAPRMPMGPAASGGGAAPSAAVHGVGF